uniref:Right border a protein n=1 Tax=Melanopsichium pennsylvanicum TaxID=63383 RepID=H2CZ04_9BASI|nr:right border a protein [Melanopsichium pennsylvanicum]
MSYRRVDSSDPRQPQSVRPLVLPKAWKSDDLDIYASFLGSVSMMSGAAMLTRAPYIAYAGLVFACAHIAHDKPFKSSKTRDASTGGPWMSLAFSFLALIALILPKAVPNLQHFNRVALAMKRVELEFIT